MNNDDVSPCGSGTVEEIIADIEKSIANGEIELDPHEPSMDQEDGINSSHFIGGAELPKSMQDPHNLRRPILFIIRGLPGSGKSTEAKRYAPEHAIATTDDYPGLYSTWRGSWTGDETVEFHGSEMLGEFPLIAHAHKANEMKVRKLMQDGEPYIVVPNTSTRHWEYHIYTEMAASYKYRCKFIDLYDAGLSDEELAERCVHNVPVYVIAKMRLRYEHQLESDFANSPAMNLFELFAEAYEEHETEIREGYENNG